MKFSLVALAAICGLATAEKAVVVNQCSTPIYVQSYPYDGGKPGPLTTVQPGKSFSEDFRRSGSTVKIAKTKTLTSPLFFGYSFSSNPDYAYYELSTEYGNPFASSRNTLSPGSGCEQFNCKANDAACYSRPGHKKVYGCPEPVNLTATICKK
ncbi:16 kDa allergen [Sarocladium implicatum]|nr:16 kDa allergen [Sarocladium implicatum]